MDSQERLRALLDAVVGISSDLDLNSTLDRISSPRYGKPCRTWLGGTVRVAERPPHGTVLELRAPLDAPAA